MSVPATRLVAIVNLTPDSFSDGGVHRESAGAIAAVEAMIARGADVIDVGAESTRPGAVPIDPDEERARLSVLPELAARCRDAGRQISLDTRHAATAAWALGFGVDWINDVSGLADLEMLRVVGDAACRLVLMHSLGVPPTPERRLVADDAVEALLDFGREEIERLASLGVARSRLVFDPGIGFGKTPRQNWQIVLGADRFAALGVPTLIGHSRKSFLRVVAGDEAAAIDGATLGVSASLMRRRIGYLRVHDMGRHATLRDLLDDVAGDGARTV